MQTVTFCILLFAEVYGRGKSEKFLADFQRETKTNVKIATKYAPLPWRLTQNAPVKALKVLKHTLMFLAKELPKKVQAYSEFC